MAYLFDDASNQRLSRVGALGMVSFSCWFYPDDATADCTLYSEHTGSGSAFLRVRILGSTTDQVALETPGGGIGSGGTVNFNTWNHVYAARGAADPSTGYISLNGESLQSAMFTAPVGSLTGTAIGVTGTTTRTSYMSGRIAEVAVWDNCLNDLDDRWKCLALAFDPRLVPVDPNGEAGLGPLNRIAYTPLIGNFNDLVIGNAWTGTVPPTLADHPRMHRQMG